MLPLSLLSPDLNVGGLVLDVEGLQLDMEERGLDVTALLLVEGDPWLASSLSLLLLEADLDLVPCPAGGQIYA